MDIGDEVLDYSESDEEGTGKEEIARVRRHVGSEDESTPFQGTVSPVPVTKDHAPSKLKAKEDDVESDEQELDYEEDIAQDGVVGGATPQSAEEYPFLSSGDEEEEEEGGAPATTLEEPLNVSHSGKEGGSVQVEEEEEDNQVEGEDGGSEVGGEDGGSEIGGVAEGDQVEGEEEGDQVEGEDGGSEVGGVAEGDQVEGEEEGDQVEGEDGGSEVGGVAEGDQVEGEEEGNQVEGEDGGSEVGGVAEGDQVEGEEEGDQVEGEDGGSEVGGVVEGDQVEGEEEVDQVEEEEEGDQVEGEEEADQVEGSEVGDVADGGKVEGEVEGSEAEEGNGRSDLNVEMEQVEQEQEADVSYSSPASDQPSADPTLEHPSAEGGDGGLSELFGSSDEEDTSISKPKRQRLESDSELEAGATVQSDSQEVPEMEEVGAQEVPEMEEVGAQEVVEQGNEEYVGSASEEEGGGSDEELAAELGDLTEGEGRVLEKVEEGEEDEEGETDDQPLPESSEGRPQVYDFDIMMEKRRAQQRRSRKRKRDINDLTADDDIVDDLVGKMRHAAEEDRKLNLAQRAATKKLSLLPLLVESLKKSDVVMRFIEAGGLEAMTDWLTPLPDHSLPNQKIRDTLLENLRNFPGVDNYTLKKSRIGKAVMLLYRHPKETRKNKEKAGKLIQDWARPIFGLTSDVKALSRDEREQRDYAHLTPSVRRRLSSSEEGQRKTGMEIDDALKPGDSGWIGRARVPMPSNKDYVVRPKWNVETEFKKSRKKTMTRYDKQVQKWRDTKKSKGATHAAKLSVAGNKMAI